MRSDDAMQADARAEQLAAQRDRFFGLTFWAVIVAEAAFWYFDVGLWAKVLLPLLWIGFLLHNNSLLILHELWELNDQVAGRKDELRELTRGARDR